MCPWYTNVPSATVMDAKQTTPPADDKSILVPLTNSLYVRGKLASASHVIVDVGTGFYVEKDIKSATEFYSNKVNEVGGSIKELDTIIQSKTNNVRVIEEGKQYQAGISYVHTG